MTATAFDYSWFGENRTGLLDGYCLTLVAGLSPQEFLARIGADTRGDIPGVAELADWSSQCWQEHGADFLFAGVTSVQGDGGDWALALEINGNLGVYDEFMVPVSAGTQAVSHFRNVNAVDYFRWYQDGDLRTHFEPLFPAHRTGSTPDVLVETMRQVGFNLSEDDTGSSRYQGHTAATFALAERLTGVRVTEELLENAVYRAGMVEIPDP